MLTALESPAAVRTAALATLDASFSEALDPATITGADLVLSRDGTALDTSSLTVTALGNGVYRFGGLAALTGQDGNYAASLRGATVADPAGNAGTGAATSEWAMAATRVVVSSLQAVTDPRNTAVTGLEVGFSGAVRAGSFDAGDLLLTRDGAPVALTGVVVAQIAPDRFRIDGLGAVTAGSGLYVLTVNGTGVLDAAGEAGAGRATRSWTTDLTAPTAVLDTIVTNPRNIVVPSVGVTFSEAIDASSFTLADLVLTRNGGANLINPSEVTIERQDATHYLVKGINWPQGVGGTYVLGLDMAGVTDLAGNAGSGTATTAWVLDIAPPPAAYDLRITPDTGASSTDGRTTARDLTLLGRLNEDGLTVRLRDMTDGTDLGEAVVTGRGFAGAFTLASLGAHDIRVRTVDAAGNTTDVVYGIFVDVGGPTVTGLSQVAPDPRTSGVESVTVNFSGPFDLSTFDAADVTLTRDGAAVDLTGVTFTPGPGNTVVVGGLAARTEAVGATCSR